MSDIKTDDGINEIFATATGIEKDEIDDSMDLGPEGLDISSLAVFEIVERLEIEYEIEIPDDDIERIHPDDEDDEVTVGDIKGLVEEKLAANS